MLQMLAAAGVVMFGLNYFYTKVFITFRVINILIIKLNFEAFIDFRYTLRCRIVIVQFCKVLNLLEVHFLQTICSDSLSFIKSVFDGRKSAVFTKYYLIISIFYDFTVLKMVLYFIEEQYKQLRPQDQP